MEDDGIFYDGSGTYRGYVEYGGHLWEEGNVYAGFHADNHSSEEGHYGIPKVYEGGGKGGVFDSLMADQDDDADRCRLGGMVLGAGRCTRTGARWKWYNSHEA